MEDVLSKILDNIETIDDLLDKNDGDTMQIVIDDLWEYVHSQKKNLWLQSVMEVK